MPTYDRRANVVLQDRPAITSTTASSLSTPPAVAAATAAAAASVRCTQPPPGVRTPPRRPRLQTGSFQSTTAGRRLCAGVALRNRKPSSTATGGRRDDADSVRAAGNFGREFPSSVLAARRHEPCR